MRGGKRSGAAVRGLHRRVARASRILPPVRPSQPRSGGVRELPQPSPPLPRDARTVALRIPLRPARAGAPISRPAFAFRILLGPPPLPAAYPRRSDPADSPAPPTPPPARDQ